MWQTAALEQELKTTRQNQEAAQLVGSVLTNVIGDYAKSQTKVYDEASLKKDLLQGQLAKATDPATRSELEKGITEVDATLALNQDKYDMWKDGGVGKIGLHGLAGYLEGRISGGPAGAAAFAAVSNEALSAAVNNAIAEAIASDKTGGSKNDAATAKAYGEAAATLIGSLAGALTGGKDGAAIGGSVALIADQNNRQLHPDEKALAKRLAQLSGGKYTASQIEAQMRGMDATINGKVEYGTPDTVLDGKPAMDSGGTWISGGGTVIVQALADKDAELRAFIVQNTTGSSVPSPITYAGPSSAPPIVKVTNTIPFNPQYYECASTECLLTGANRNPNNPINQAQDQHTKDVLLAGAVISAGPLALTPLGQYILFANGGAGIIGGSINASAQYLTQNGRIDPVDVGVATLTGYAGGASQLALLTKYGTGFLGQTSSFFANLGTNVGGTIVSNQIKGESSNNVPITIIGTSAAYIPGYYFGRLSPIAGNISGSALQEAINAYAQENKQPGK